MLNFHNFIGTVEKVQQLVETSTRRLTHPPWDAMESCTDVAELSGDESQDQEVDDQEKIIKTSQKRNKLIKTKVNHAEALLKELKIQYSSNSSDGNNDKLYIKQLRTEVLQLKEKNQEMRKENKRLRTGVSQLKEENQEMKKESKQLRTEVLQLKEENQEMKKENAMLRKLNEELQRTVIDDWKELSKKLGSMKNQVEEKNEQDNLPIDVGVGARTGDKVHLGRNVFICESTFDAICFKSKNKDAIFVKMLASAVFGDHVLLNSSVTGAKCNRLKMNDPKPKLCETKLMAIRDIFQHCLIKRGETPKEVGKKVGQVNYYLAQKIADLRRAANKTTVNVKNYVENNTYNDFEVIEESENNDEGDVDFDDEIKQTAQLLRNEGIMSD